MNTSLDIITDQLALFALQKQIGQLPIPLPSKQERERIINDAYQLLWKAIFDTPFPSKKDKLS